MALKDWKRARSGESKNYPVVWRRKDDGDDVLAIKYYALFKQYELQRNDVTFFRSKSKQEALAYAKSYMRSH